MVSGGDTQGAAIASVKGSRAEIDTTPYGSGEAQVCGDWLVRVPLGPIIGAMEGPS
jgi:hypothetical protein